MTPAEAGRMHALQAIATHASDQAAARLLSDMISPANRAYLKSYAATCEAIAARCRASPGYSVTEDPA